MRNFQTSILTVALTCVVALAGCKPKQDGQPKVSDAAPAPVVSAVAPAMHNETTAAHALNKFDLNTVPVSTATLPPFPYFDWPGGVMEGLRFESKSDYDQAYVVAGDELKAVAGRYSHRRFATSDAHLSAFAAHKLYEDGIIALGGVKVASVDPVNNHLVDQNHGDVGDLVTNKLKIEHAFEAKSWDYYLIRRSEGNVWIGLVISDGSTEIIAVQEGEMKSAITFLKADAMQNELKSKGKVALYLNFDTDKATIREDGKAQIDEIVNLLNADPSLKLAVNGYTDNVGDAHHNEQLSRQRAEAVVAALVSRKIDTSRLKFDGFGPNNPLDDNNSENGRAKNRRVELVKLS